MSPWDPAVGYFPSDWWRIIGTKTIGTQDHWYQDSGVLQWQTWPCVFVKHFLQRFYQFLSFKHHLTTVFWLQSFPSVDPQGFGAILAFAKSFNTTARVQNLLSSTRGSRRKRCGDLHYAVRSPLTHAQSGSQITFPESLFLSSGLWWYPSRTKLR